MHWLSAKNISGFLTGTILLTIFIAAPASANPPSGVYNLTGTQSPSSLVITTPDGTAHPVSHDPPINAGNSITEKLGANVQADKTNPSECTIDDNSTTFSYPSCTMSYSSNGGKTFSAAGGGAGISVDNAATGDATLSATFGSAGYYKIDYKIHVTYKSATCGDGSLDDSEELTFSVDAGDFSFSLNPGSLNINQGENAVTKARITSIKDFSQSVGFSVSGAGTSTGISAGGSGTPPPSGSTQDPVANPGTKYPDAPVSVSVDNTVPLGPQSIFVRGSSIVGTVLLSHDQSLSVTVTKRGLTITRAGAHDERLNASGNKSGDTIYSSISYSNGPSAAPNLNTQTFAISFLGTWSMTPSTTSAGLLLPLPHEDVSFTWTPNESNDTYNSGIWQVPYGTINYALDVNQVLVPSGTRDQPVGQTISYKATDNVTGKQASISYGLTVHDEVEGMTDSITPVETVPTALFGTFGNTGLFQQPGPFNHLNQTIYVTTGIESSSGWSFDVGVDIPFAKWAPLWSLSPGVGYSFNNGVTTSITTYLNFDVAAGFYTYPEYVNKYNRHLYTWREFDAGGEKILHNLDNSVKPHSHSEDVFTGGYFLWARPVSLTVAPPQYSSTPVYTPH